MANKLTESDVVEKLQKPKTLTPRVLNHMPVSIMKHKDFATDNVTEAAFGFAEKCDDPNTLKRILVVLDSVYAVNPMTAKSAHFLRFMAISRMDQARSLFAVSALNLLLAHNREAAQMEGLADWLADTGTAYNGRTRASCLAALKIVLTENRGEVTPTLVKKLEKLRNTSQAHRFQQIFPDASDPDKRMITNGAFATEIFEMANKLANEKSFPEPPAYKLVFREASACPQA